MQSSFQFEPELFGNYREPQENILAGVDDSFFADALEGDFALPYNMAPSPVVPKNDLIAAIDAAKEADSADAPALLTCNKIWYGLYFNMYARSPSDKLLTAILGRNSRIAPRSRRVISIWMLCAATCRRKPSALDPEPSWMRKISRASCRSIWARTASNATVAQAPPPSPLPPSPPTKPDGSRSPLILPCTSAVLYR